MNEVPALSTLCTDYIVNNGQNYFSPLCANSILQKIYIRRKIFNFFGGYEVGDTFSAEEDSVPNMMIIEQLKTLLKKGKPIPFPYPELKDKTLYIHALGDFGYDGDLTLKDDVECKEAEFIYCHYLVLGTQKLALYALVSDQTRRPSDSTPDLLGCNYDIYRLSDYGAPEAEALSKETVIDRYVAGQLACLIINGFPCHANIDWHDCTLTVA